MSRKRNRQNQVSEEFSRSEGGTGTGAGAGDVLPSPPPTPAPGAPEYTPRPTPDAISTGRNPDTGADPGVPGRDDDEDYISIDDFKFLECDPQIPGEDFNPCPACRPNPYAYVPDYRLMSDGEVFFDGKECTQNIVFTLKAPNKNPDLSGPTVSEIEQNIKTYMRDGIFLLLDYFGKSDVMTQYYYEPSRELKKKGAVDKYGKYNLLPRGDLPTPAYPVGASAAVLGTGEYEAYIPPPVKGYNLKFKEINVIEELLQYTTYKIHVPIQKMSRTRVLISVPVEQFNRIPERVITLLDEEVQGDMEVTIMGEDFLPMLRRISRAFKVYNGALINWRTLEGGMLVEAGQSRVGPKKAKPAKLDLDAEAKHIENFADHIDKMVRDEAGLSFSPLKPARAVEKITFKMKSEGPKKIRLRQIIFNKVGCEDIRITENGRYKGIFNELTKKSPFKKSRTLYYISKAPDIDTDLGARAPTPWLQVVTSYTFPALEVFFGQNKNTIYNDPTILKCFASGPLDDVIDSFMEQFTDEMLGLPDAILAEFARGSCHTREELREQLKKDGSLFGKENNLFAMETMRALKEGKRKLSLDNPYLNIVLEELFPGEASMIAQQKTAAANGENLDYQGDNTRKSIRKFYKDEELKIWERLNNRLGWCGWTALVLQALDCVAKGLGEDSTTKLLAEAAFGSMEDKHLGRVFLGLSPEDQRNIVSKVEGEFGSIPAPWDRNYRTGNNTYPEFPDYADSETVPGLADDIDATKRDVRNAAENEYKLNNPDASDKEIRDAGTNAIKDVNAQLMADRSAFEQPGTGGAGGTYGTALSGVQKAVFDAYKNAMLDVVGADTLLEQLNSLPGAPIVANLFKHLPCKYVPPFYTNPRMDDFLKTLEFDVCQWDIDMTMPVLNSKIGQFWDILELMWQAIKEAIEDLIMALFMAALKLILEKILSLACDIIGVAGASLLDLFAGNDHFRNLLRENMCPDATESDLYDALRNIFGAMNNPDASCLEQLSNAALGAFIDDLSLMLTQNQILELLNGSVSGETMQLALEVAATSDSECIREIFSDPSALADFFSSLTPFIPNLEDLNEAVRSAGTNAPVYPCPPDILQNIDDLKCQLLAEKGLTPEECRDQLDDIKDKAIQDLSDLADILQNGPFSNIPPLESLPGCEPGILPRENPLNSSAAQSVTAILFEQVEVGFMKDCWSPLHMGQGGILNAVLSDTKGRPFKKHNWMVKNFGAPLAVDLRGWFNGACDNAIAAGAYDPDGNNKPIDIYGQELAGDEGGKRGIAGYGDGGFPPTVGAHLAKQFADLKPEFKTVNTPDDSRQAFDRVKDENDKRVRKRKKYIEAFIDEFNLEDRKTSFKEKFRAAATDLRAGADMQLFDRQGKDIKFKKYSPGDRTQNVLRGKNISIAGELVGTKQPKKWSDKNKKKAGVGDSKSFVDHYEQGEWYRLRALPDTSSADVRMKYKGYNDDPRKNADPDFSGYEIDIQYDYNLFDEETGKLKKDFEYNLKIVETHRSSKGGSLTKNERKELGDVPPGSILGESVYIFPKYDLKIQSATDSEVIELIDTLNIPDSIPDSNEVEILYRYMSDILVKNSSNTDETIRKTALGSFRNYFSDKTYDDISSAFFQKISTMIASGKYSNDTKNRGPDEDDLSRKEEKNQNQIGLEQISRGFLFGYDPYKEPKIIELDPMEYGGPLARAFPDSVPPPFYVQERKQKGWMDIANALVPEVDGCEVARESVFNLGDLQSMVSELSNSLVKDERLEYDPTCVKEAPFDRIMTSFDAANIEGAIRAVIRIYIVDAYLRGVPVFVTFGLNEDNYDSLLQSFISERMRYGLYHDGTRRSGRTDDEYYYRVLEQAVNNTVRKIDSGLLQRGTYDETGNFVEADFSFAEEEALTKIIKEVKKFYRVYDGEPEVLSDVAIKSQDVLKRVFSPPANAPLGGLSSGSTRFNKAAAKLAKQEAFELTVREVEEEAKVILGMYIREEFTNLTKKMSEFMPPTVSNIHHLFLLDDQWIRGAIYNNGPFHVTADPADPAAYNIEPMTTELPPLPFMPKTEISTHWPFVLEKYIKIEEKSSPRPPREIRRRKDNLYNVVNIEEWHSYVNELKSEGVSGNISEFWGNPHLSGETIKIENHTHEYTIDENGNGITSVHKHSDCSEHYHEIENYVLKTAKLNPNYNGHIHELPSEGWKFGLRICYVPSSDDRGLFRDLIADIDDDTRMKEKAFKVSKPGQDEFLIPIASAELPIPDQKFTLFDPESYDVYCLIDELINTPEYKLLFKTIFPLSRYTSILATYGIMALFDSIGNTGFPADGGDMWEVAGGRQGRKFRNWDRSPETVFKKSRQAARMVFTSLYEGSQAIDYDTSNSKTDPLKGPTKIREMIRPKVNFEDGLRWWERGRRIKKRPFNKDGDEC